MDEIEILMSDEFVAFSKKITELHSLKLEKQTEAKNVIEQLKVDMRTIDDEAKKANLAWEAFKAKKLAEKKN